MKFFILAAFITVSLASEQDCPRACPTIYDPVCAKSTDGIYKTFVNLCELQIQNCKHQETGYEFMKNGQCFDDQMHILCTDKCFGDYDPVCVQTDDGRLITYSNLCEFEKQLCESGGSGMKFIKNGECNEYSKKIMGCPVACTEEYEPVCTKSNQGEMKTFSNKCQFEMYKCQNGDFDLQMIKEGSCSVEKNMRCPVVCSKEYKPVCTKSGNGEMKTFSNMCVFEMYQCQNRNLDLQILREGVCSVEPKNNMECPVACMDIYEPICTQNVYGKLVTFNNKCQFQLYACNYVQTSLRFYKNGRC